MLRAANCIPALLAMGCAQIVDVDDYAVASGPSAATRGEVARFLGDGDCETCIFQECAAHIDACVADRGCAEPASCMSRCSDPACIFLNCRGAELPEPGSPLAVLANCAAKQCKTPCEVGTSWSCGGNYDWPPPRSEAFDLSVSIDIWNDNWDPSPHLVGARVGLCNDKAALGTDPGATTTCPSNAWLAPEGTTNAEGRVALRVKPVPGVSGPTLPPSHFYVDATPVTATQQYPTLAWRVEMNQPLRPWTGESHWIVLPQGAPVVGANRYLCGYVLDCHGWVALTADGVTTDLESYGAQYPHYFMIYWDSDQVSHFDHTYLGGTFCAGIGQTASEAPAPGGYFWLNVDDASTHERRISSLMGVPSDGDAAVLLFPPTTQDAMQR